MNLFSGGHPTKDVSLPAEAILAVTGIFHDETLGPRDGHQAALLPGEWRTSVKAFFEQSKPRKFKLYPRPPHEATLDKLVAGIDKDRDERLTARLASEEVANDYRLTLSNAIEYVRARWPALRMDTFAKPRLVSPGWATMAEAYAVLAVIDRPGRLVDEMLMGTLLAEQVDAVKAVYPNLFEMLRGMIEERRQLSLARSQSWTIPWRLERVLRILAGLPPDIDISQAPQAPARAGRAKVDIDFASSQTRAQRLEAK